VAGVDLGVISRRGDAAMAGFALDAAAQVLPYFNDYFGARYPLPKLDLVAVPAGRSFGAMENWGAITFPDAWLLLDARVSTESDRREVYDTIAHEVAHQWFGNLVTMAWWDDLWLNEGFATWMARKVTAHLHPEWDVWLLSEPKRRAAMIEDAGAGTHPVVTPIRDARQADNAAFDAITYDKGAAVVRMIESYVGEEAFRSGVRAYLARYAHASTVSADLWRELGAASSLPVDRIASDFTQQAGVPMIDVDEADGVVTLSQRRFGIDAEARAQPSWARSWHVPVAALDGEGQVQHAIVSAPQPVTLPAAQALLVNSGQAGYFVSRYAPEPFRRLLQRLPTLPAGDQLGLFSDTSALARAGYVPMASMLDLVAALPADGAAALWSTVCQDLVRLGRRYGEGAPARAYRAWLRTRLQAVLARVGWEPQGGESGNAPQLRAALLTALAEADDEGVIAEARRRFDRLAVAPDALVGDQRDTVLAIVALHADAAAWERLRAMARATKPGPEREQMYRVLGSARDAALAQRTLQLIVSGEAPRAAAADILLMVGERHPAATFDFVASQWSRIAPMLTPSFASGLAPRIAAGSDEPETAERLSDFARRVGPACDPDEVRKAVATIHFLASIKRERLTEVDRWLGDHAS
jgi:aminopeptidase N